MLYLCHGTMEGGTWEREGHDGEKEGPLLRACVPCFASRFLEFVSCTDSVSNPRYDFQIRGFTDGTSFIFCHSSEKWPKEPELQLTTLEPENVKVSEIDVCSRLQQRKIVFAGGVMGDISLAV